MRILVISDSHGRKGEIDNVIEAQSTAKHIFFLGDCVRDVEDLVYIYSDRTFHIVEGNCDGYTIFKSADALTLYGKRILFTHGHCYSVKSGFMRLYEAAEQAGADIVLFGHTHTPLTEYVNGRYYVNPGSLYRGTFGYTSYAVVDIEKNGIKPIIIKR